MRRLLLLLLLLPAAARAQAPSLDLPGRPVGDAGALPSPEAWFGFPLGARHLSHDEITGYFRMVAERSDRVRWVPYGRTHEHRPCFAVAVSAPRHLDDAALERIRAHQRGLTAGASADPALPLVIYQGASVHGNEASGANAAVAYLWRLASSPDTALARVLDRTLILLDPALNPDGVQRFAGWVNMHRGVDADADAHAREHAEAWPGGRTNHYWFDLNRDWMPLTQPESRGRLALFHAWRPQVVTDHHEMGSSSTFFFQPGVPQRTHPLTPAENQALTGRIGAYHARALEALGHTFYSGEDYDDFYYGKGSTYPDANGSVGILFEQASARGHRQEGARGEVGFGLAIRHQLATMWSTLEAADALRGALREHTRAAYRAARAEARRRGGGYLVGHSGDAVRDTAFAALMGRHRVRLALLDEDLEAGGLAFARGRAWFVPRDQEQARLVEAFFERRTAFADSLFYDVSAWTLPLAWGLPLAGVEGRAPDTLPWAPAIARPAPLPAGAYAWLLDGNADAAPRHLARLLDAGAMVQLGTEAVRAITPAGPRRFPAGTWLVRSGRQPLPADTLLALLSEARAGGVPVTAVTGGLTPEGPDLGSRAWVPLAPRRIAIAVGDGVNAYDAGALWHLLDRVQRLHPTLLERVDAGSLEGIDVLFLPDGSYGGRGEGFWNALEAWTAEGGTLVAQAGAARDLALRDWSGLRVADRPEPAEPDDAPYADADRRAGARVLGGAIFAANADTTHPLLHGLAPSLPGGGLPVFLRGEPPLAGPENAYAAPLRVADPAPLAGYAHPDGRAAWDGAPLVVAARHGRGRVIGLAFPTAFRAFWKGTERLALNAAFYAPALSWRTLDGE